MDRDRVERGEKEGLTVDERARFQQLERENAELRMICSGVCLRRAIVMSLLRPAILGNGLSQQVDHAQGVRPDALALVRQIRRGVEATPVDSQTKAPRRTRWMTSSDS